jgi:nicotinamidase-related amidase
VIKRTVECVLTNVFDGSGRLYRVTKLTNTVEPTVGEGLSATELKDLMRRPGWTVIIKEGKVEQ